MSMWREILVGLLVGIPLTVVALNSDRDNTDRQNALSERLATQAQDIERDRATQAESLENARFVRQTAMSRSRLKPFQGFNLEGAVLSGLPLWCTSQRDNTSCANLEGANLYRADLTGAKLQGAQMRSAKLTEANLFATNLTEAELLNAELAWATLNNATLTDANLMGANLTVASLREANLWGTNLIGAELSGANLTGADLSNSYLTGVDLSHIQLDAPAADSAIEYSIDLYGAHLGGANLSNLDLSEANLDGVEWRGNPYWIDARPSKEQTGPHDSFTLNYRKFRFGDGKVGLPCIDGTIFPPGYQAPQKGDCSRWSYPSLDWGEDMVAVAHATSGELVWRDHDITAQLGDRLVFTGRLHNGSAASSALTLHAKQETVFAPYGTRVTINISDQTGELLPATDDVVVFFVGEAPLRLTPIPGTTETYEMWGHDEAGCQESPGWTPAPDGLWDSVGLPLPAIGYLHMDEPCSERALFVHFEAEVTR